MGGFTIYELCGSSHGIAFDKHNCAFLYAHFISKLPVALLNLTTR